MIFGLDVAECCFRALDDQIVLERLVEEGEWREGGEVLRLDGSARAILTAERTALNFLGRLSGVATLTARCVQRGGGHRRDDPRHAQDHAGLRALEKAAVAAGGGRITARASTTRC